MGYQPTTGPKNPVPPQIISGAIPYKNDLMVKMLNAGMISFEEAGQNMTAAFGVTLPHPPQPAYESMLLTAGYEASLRCEP